MAERLPQLVTTPRLVLRTWQVDDAEALAAAIAASLDHLLPWMPWAALEPLPIEDRRKLITGWETEWEAGHDVVFGVFLDGAVIGGCGLHRRIGPHGIEIGYWIHADHIRQGYATELSLALTDVAFTIDGIERVEIHHDRANAASRGVPRTLGYELTGETSAEILAPSETGVNCVWAVTLEQWADRERSGERE